MVIVDVSALFSGPMKWITFRFYFVYGKAPTRSNRTKLVTTAMNSLGISLDFDIFDFRCNAENYKVWYESWITYVKTEGKKQIARKSNKPPRILKHTAPTFSVS